MTLLSLIRRSAFVAACFGFALPCAAAQGAAVNNAAVMLGQQMGLGSANHTDLLLLGDSITVGHTAEPGFRDDLHALLSGVAGHTYTFLGGSGSAPLNGHFLGGRQTNHFYPASFGNGWGWGTFDMTPQMGPVVPSLVCFMVGTNDLDFDHPPFSTYSYDHGQSLVPGQAGQFAEAIQYLLRWQDGSVSTTLKTVVLSTLVPFQGRETDVQDFNDAIIAFAEDLAEGVATGSPVRVALVDPHTPFVGNPNLFTFGPGDWMTDSIHPNDTGYTEIANVLFETISSITLDFAAPAAIHDLEVVSVTDTTATLSFTATGDDDELGTAARYDLRQWTYSINSHSFGVSTQVMGEPVPQASGLTETIVVQGLLPGTAYEFAVKASDTAGHRSAISNVVSTGTSGASNTMLTLRQDLTGYTGVGDNSMTSGPSDGNMGGNETLYSGVIGGSTIRRGLIRFDLSFLPKDVEVVDARLRLYNHAAESGSPADVSLYRLTKRWVQGEETLFARTGLSCWDAPHWQYQSWSSAGADQASDSAQNNDPAFDRFATPEGTLTVDLLNTWYEWNVTSAAAKWVSGDWDNEGLLIRTDSEVAGSGRHFHSSEYLADPTLRPTLIITVQSAGH